jgi:hypothetical protein
VDIDKCRRLQPIKFDEMRWMKSLFGEKDNFEVMQ